MDNSLTNNSGMDAQDVTEKGKRVTYVDDMEDHQGSLMKAAGQSGVLSVPSFVTKQELEDLRLPAPVQPLASPSPLGLLGFAMATLVSAATKLGLDTPGNSSFVAVVGLMLGGIVQLIAGVMCFYKNNTFSLVTFTGFGSHWFLVGLSTLLGLSPISDFNTDYAALNAVYLGLWTLFSCIIWVATLRINKVMTFTLTMVVCVFGFDAGGEFSEWAKTTSGVFGVLATFGAMWLFAADYINEIWNQTLIPLWPHDDHAHEYDKKNGYVPKLHYHKEATSSVAM